MLEVQNNIQIMIKFLYQLMLFNNNIIIKKIKIRKKRKKINNNNSNNRKKLKINKINKKKEKKQMKFNYLYMKRKYKNF